MSQASETRRELARLLIARGFRGARATAPEAPRRVRLSRGQRRLWYLEQLQPGTARQNVGLRLDLTAPPGEALVRDALHRLQSTHDALRFRFTIEDGEPQQEPVSDVRVPLAWHDLSGRDAVSAEAQALAIADAEARRPIDLGDPPPYRAAAIVLPGERWQLVLVFHHILVDGWSVGVMLRDLQQLLAGHPVAPPATTFARWIAQRDDGEPSADAVRYWRAQFADQPPAATLAPREAPEVARGGLLPVALGRELTARVDELARQLGATAYVVCLAAFQALLRMRSDADAVVVGSPAAGRDDPELDRVVGFFAGTLALRTDIALRDSFAEVVRRTHRAVLGALDHQPMPFDELVHLAGRSGADGTHPLFRCMLAWQSAGLDRFAWAGRHSEITDLDTGTALFDLTFSLTRTAHDVRGTVGWAERGADAITAGAAWRAFRSILSAAVQDPELRVGELPLEDPAAALPRAREPVREPGARGSLADGLARQVAATPDAIAIVDDAGHTLTYQQLGARVFGAAAQLRRRGLVPGDRVALVLERSVDMIVCVHAVTAAGCAYVPIDTGAPAERIRRLLDAADPRMVLVHGATAPLVPDGPWQVLALSALERDGGRFACATTPAPAPAPAYLLFTSGSTGEPKLVVFPSDTSQQFLDWLQATAPIGPGSKVLLKTPYGFDVSVWELFWPLQHGATIVVARPSGHLDPRYLAQLVQRERVHVVNFVPSLLEVFLDEPEAAGCTSLAWILSAGEELRPALRDRVHARWAGATLVNLYGPTECGAITIHEVARDDHSSVVPIGTPPAYAPLHVLDANLRPLPPGLHGELCVGGEFGIATGYWNDGALTAARFVPDPFSSRPGARLYRTGDLARQLPGGAYEYLGRLDRQLKLHGVRIDPAEIESALARHPAVAAVRVVALGDGDQRELVAFYVADSGRELPAQALRQHAAAQLPRHLVPATLLAIERVPVNVNGKTDAAALHAIWREHRRQALESTRRAHLGDATGGAAADGGAASDGGAAIDRVRAAFEDVLRRPVTGVDASFFELGGSSLLLLKLAAELERQFGHRPGIAELVAHPTVRAMSAMLGARSPSGSLVPLAHAPGAPRLVLLHASSGSVLPYLPLGRALGAELSVYGIESPGLDRDRVAPRTVAACVEGMIDLVAPLAGGDPPLLLGGWSFGGVLAYELSVALARTQRAPAATLLFDAWVPSPSAASSTDRVNAVAFLRSQGAFPDGLPERDQRALERVVDASMAAFSAYQPSRGARNPIYLIRAADGYPADDVAGYGPDRGWHAVVDDLRVSDVTGNHFELLDARHVPALADEVRRIARISINPIREDSR